MKPQRSSIVLVFNQKGELALQKRAAHDTSYPSHWDFSAAGGIDDHEESEQAAIRELREEVGVEASPEYIGEFLYKDETVEDQLFVYRVTYDGVFSPDPNEVSDVRFFTLNQISKMLDSNQKFHPEFPFLWNMGIIKQ